MNTLRILGLDDDNHAPCFRCEDGTSFDNCQQLVEFLSKPHDCQVEVRMFAIVDNWTPEMEELGEAMVDEWFYFLECCNCAPDDTDLPTVFDMFWRAANRLHW